MASIKKMAFDETITLVCPISRKRYPKSYFQASISVHSHPRFLNTVSIFPSFAVIHTSSRTHTPSPIRPSPSCPSVDVYNMISRAHKYTNFIICDACAAMTPPPASSATNTTGVVFGSRWPNYRKTHARHPKICRAPSHNTHSLSLSGFSR